MSEKSTTDQILDLLLEALQERQAAQKNITSAVFTPSETLPSPHQDSPEMIDPSIKFDDTDTHTIPIADNNLTGLAEPDDTENSAEINDETATIQEPPAYEPTIHLGHLLTRMMIGIAFLAILVNLPFNRHGTALARAMPDEQALIVRDGLLLKGSSEEIYILENNQRRWITTLEAFHYYGYRWEHVHEVEDEFLNSFAEGRPVYLVLKCFNSPHIYAFEAGKKRWIKDPPTFEKLGFNWHQIDMVDCNYLRNLPDGIPFPADAGEPPQP